MESAEFLVKKGTESYFFFLKFHLSNFVRGLGALQEFDSPEVLLDFFVHLKGVLLELSFNLSPGFDVLVACCRVLSLFQFVYSFLVSVKVSHGANEFAGVIFVALQILDVVLNRRFEDILRRNHAFLAHLH